MRKKLSLFISNETNRQIIELQNLYNTSITDTISRAIGTVHRALVIEKTSLVKDTCCCDNTRYAQTKRNKQAN